MFVLCLFLLGASVDGDGRDRPVVYTLSVQDPSVPEDCEKMSNMGTFNSSHHHHSTNSLNLNIEKEDEEEVALAIRGAASGGRMPLSPHSEGLPSSFVHAPALRRSKSQSRPPQVVKFSDDTVDNGYNDGYDVSIRKHPMSEKPQRRIYYPDERGPERNRPSSHHGRSKQHNRKQGRHHRSRKTRSDNALHMVPLDKSQRLYEHHQQGLVNPQSGAVLPQHPSQRLPKAYLQTRSDYMLGATQGDQQVEHFMGLYRDDEDWCSTCSSSSSDSEEEGFFLGQPIPQPRMVGRYYAEDLPTRVTALSCQIHGSKTGRRKGHRSKNCIIS